MVGWFLLTVTSGALLLIAANALRERLNKINEQEKDIYEQAARKSQLHAGKKDENASCT